MVQLNMNGLPWLHPAIHEYVIWSRSEKGLSFPAVDGTRPRRRRLFLLDEVVEEEEEDDDDTNVGAWMMMMTVLSYRLAVLTVSLFVTFSFQHHLFVWSVFAPKFVYEVGQTFVVVVFIFIFFAWQSLQTALRRTKSKNITKKVTKKIV